MVLIDAICQDDILLRGIYMQTLLCDGWELVEGLGFCGVIISVTMLLFTGNGAVSGLEPCRRFLYLVLFVGFCMERVS